MSVLHIDNYTVGTNLNVDCDKEFMITACSMCTFVVNEPVAVPSAMTYTLRPGPTRNHAAIQSSPQHCLGQGQQHLPHFQVDL